MTDIRTEQEINGLVKCVQEEKDQEAMTKIIKKLKPFRFALAKKFLNKGVEFDDIVQQIDLKIVEAILDYDETKDASALRHLTSRARNGVWNYYRKEMNYFNENKTPLSIEGLKFQRLSNGDREFFADYYDSEQLAVEFDEDRVLDNIILNEELDKLTPHQKEILFMCFVDDKTQYDIAEELNINQSNVSRAKKRGIRSIKYSIIPADELDENS